MSNVKHALPSIKHFEIPESSASNLRLLFGKRPSSQCLLWSIIFQFMFFFSDAACVVIFALNMSQGLALQISDKRKSDMKVHVGCTYACIYEWLNDNFVQKYFKAFFPKNTLITLFTLVKVNDDANMKQNSENDKLYIEHLQFMKAQLISRQK